MSVDAPPPPLWWFDATAAPGWLDRVALVLTVVRLIIGFVQLRGLRRAVLAHVDSLHEPAPEIMFAGCFRLGELIALHGGDVRGGVVINKAEDRDGYTADTKTGQHKRVELLERGRRAWSSCLAPSGTLPCPRGERAERMPRRSLQVRGAQLAQSLATLTLASPMSYTGLSLVAEAGASERVIHERANHASATSKRRYLHTNERMHANAVERVDAMLSKLRDKAS